MERRRKVTTTGDDDAPLVQLPLTGTYCKDCLDGGLKIPQRRAPGGATCKFGHGGAVGVDMPEDELAALQKLQREHTEAAAVADVASRPPAHTPSPAGFNARAGDTLVIHYTGAKLQIAPYTTVEVDSAIYTRRLEDGEDPEVEFAKIYDFVKNQCIGRARQKMATFADELAKAKKRAAGGE